MLQRLPIYTPAQDVDANAPHYWSGLSKVHTDSPLAYVEAAPPLKLGRIPTLADYLPPSGNGKLGPDAFDNL